MKRDYTHPLFKLNQEHPKLIMYVSHHGLTLIQRTPKIIQGSTL